MFSQFRHVVENLAQPPRRSLSDDVARSSIPGDLAVASASPPSGHGLAGRGSAGLASESSLANISSLRRTLAPQRTASPTPAGRAADRESPAATGRRITLEERLKAAAAFTVGEASPGDTPLASRATTPMPAPVPGSRGATPQNTMSPASTPLPESPMVKALEGSQALLSSDTLALSPASHPLADDASPPAVKSTSPPPSLAQPSHPLAEVIAVASPIDETADTSAPIADVAPPASPVADSPATHVPTSPYPPGSSDTPSSVEGSTATTFSIPAPLDTPSETPSVEVLPAPAPSPPADVPPSSDVLDSSPSVEPLVASTADKAAEPPVDVPDESAVAPPPAGTDGVLEADVNDEDDLAHTQPPPAPPSPVVTASPSNPEDIPVGSPAEPSPAAASVDEPATPATPSDGALGSDKLDTCNKSTPGHEADVDTLRNQLKRIEQRFADVSASFKKLQEEKSAADSILRELTPLDGLGDADTLRDYLQNVTSKAEISQDEITRLNGKLIRQEERLDELRDTHRLEHKSQHDLIDNLRKQVEDAETGATAARAAAAKAEAEAAQRKADLERVQVEATLSRTSAKEEEEKRVKAISLLKTVRQKLVKTEKERDDALRDAGGVREREGQEREREKAEKARLAAEIEKANAEREKAIMGIKTHFDREVANLKDKQEREITALKAQFELENTTRKTNYSSELNSKEARIVILEKSVQSLTQEKNRLFEQVQIRQAEFESSQSHLESLQSQTTELQYQLREAGDRVALLNEELIDARREQENRVREPFPDAADAARVLALTEARYESRVAELRKQLAAVERERNEGETDWSRKLEQKAREIDELRRVLDSSADTRAQREEVVEDLRREGERVKDEVRRYQDQILQLQRQAEKALDVEDTVREQVQQFQDTIAGLKKQLEEFKGRESQLRLNNKTLRDELRKVQSSAALLERTRSPGVGYWGASRTESTQDVRTSMSATDLSSQNGSSRSGSPAPGVNEEEVNLEYLRNVILQFLEHKEMRPNLVRVLSAVLSFTPQETRRLIAKV